MHPVIACHSHIHLILLLTCLFCGMFSAGQTLGLPFTLRLTLLTWVVTPPTMLTCPRTWFIDSCAWHTVQMQGREEKAWLGLIREGGSGNNEGPSSPPLCIAKYTPDQLSIRPRHSRHAGTWTERSGQAWKEREFENRTAAMGQNTAILKVTHSLVPRWKCV